MSWLDKYFVGITGVQAGGGAQPSWPTLNFGTGLSVTPNVPAKRLDIAATGGAIFYEPTLDPTSSTVVAGDSVVSASVGSSANVTRAAAATLAFAPTPIGIVTVGASAGGTPTVQTTGAVAASVVSLGAGASAQVYVVPSTGKVARLTAPRGNEAIVGTCDSQGNVTLNVRKYIGTGPAHFFRVIDYGAIPDRVAVSDAAMSSTSNQHNLNSASGLFIAADVGKLVWVLGAGIAGAALATTIASYVSPTQVTTTTACATTVSGALAAWGTDNHAAIVGAVAAKDAAGGGTIFVPRGGYMSSAAVDVGTKSFLFSGEHGDPQASLGSVLQFVGVSDGLTALTAPALTYGVVRDLLLLGSDTAHGAGFKASPTNALVIHLSNVSINIFGQGYNPGNMEDCSLKDVAIFNCGTGLAWLGEDATGVPNNIKLYNVTVQQCADAAIFDAGVHLFWFGGLVQANTRGVTLGSSSFIFEEAHFHGVWFEDNGSHSGPDVVFNAAAIVSFDGCRFAADNPAWTYGTPGTVNCLTMKDCLTGYLHHIGPGVTNFTCVNPNQGLNNEAVGYVVLNNPVSQITYLGVDTDSAQIQGARFGRGGIPLNIIQSILAPQFLAGSRQMNNAPYGANVTRGWANVQDGISTFAWQPTTGFAANSYVHPNPQNGHVYQNKGALGTSGASIPVWPTGAGSTVVDGGITWTEVGADTIWVQEEDWSYENISGVSTSETINRPQTAQFSDASSHDFAVQLRPGNNTVNVEVVAKDATHYASWVLRDRFSCVANPSASHPLALTITEYGGTTTIEAAGDNAGHTPTGWSVSITTSANDGTALVRVANTNGTQTFWTVLLTRTVRT